MRLRQRTGRGGEAITVIPATAKSTFPIVGWGGPSGAMIRPEILRGMAEAGFTVSHSWVTGDASAVARVLDVAAEAGMPLLLAHAAWHVADDFVLDDARRRDIEWLVRSVRGHPGLFGYHLRDEPRFGLLPLLAEAEAFMRSVDDEHLVYVNHFPPIEGWGAPTAEAFWWRYVGLSKPRLLSFDHYPITIGTESEVRAGAGLPHVFPVAKIVVKPDFFSCLEIVRSVSVASGIPFWAFACSVRHGPHPLPTEGHLRFQLMNDLAYGARGLQYFTYAHDGAMVRPDGTLTETWELARKINRDILAMAPVLGGLRSIGVFRTGPLWDGTRRLHRSHLEPLVECEGDAVTIGFFLDPGERLHLMLVNGSPVDWSRVTLRVRVSRPEDKLYVFDPPGGEFRELWPANPREQLVTFAPGEGRLFRVGGEGKGAGF
jgi:hypothetical protein